MAKWFAESSPSAGLVRPNERENSKVMKFDGPSNRSVVTPLLDRALGHITPTRDDGCRFDEALHLDPQPFCA